MDSTVSTLIGKLFSVESVPAQLLTIPGNTQWHPSVEDVRPTLTTM